MSILKPLGSENGKPMSDSAMFEHCNAIVGHVLEECEGALHNAMQGVDDAANRAQVHAAQAVLWKKATDRKIPRTEVLAQLEKLSAAYTVAKSEARAQANGQLTPAQRETTRNIVDAYGTCHALIAALIPALRSESDDGGELSFEVGKAPPNPESLTGDLKEEAAPAPAPEKK